MKSTLLWLIAAALPLCAQPPAAAPKAAAPKTAAPKVAAPVRPPGLYATISVSHGATPLGRIVFKLYEKESPITVKNFTELALGQKEWMHPQTQEKSKKPFYNGLTFHRVIPGFMIQGGDPTGTGSGRTQEIPDEFHPELKFDIPGRVAMANAGPGTGSCQFFITEAPTPHLTGRHTIFGQVVEGQPLVEKIARLQRGANDKPDTPVIMTRVAIARAGPVAGAAKPAAKKATTTKKAATPPAVKKATPAATPPAPPPAVKKATPAAAPAATPPAAKK